MADNIEIWRPVVGYEDLYEISNLGGVKSFSNHHWKNTTSLKQCAVKKYLHVVLYKNGKRKFCRVHRLVAQAFPEICGEWFEGCVINHKDCDPSNNRAENLEVCTQKYNCNWANAPLKKRQTLLNYPKYSKPIVQKLDSKIIASYPSAKEVWRQTGYDRSYINRCCRGKVPTAYGFEWEFA